MTNVSCNFPFETLVSWGCALPCQGFRSRFFHIFFHILTASQLHPFIASSLLDANYRQGSEILINLVDVDIHGVSQYQHQTPGPADLWGLAAPDPHPSGPCNPPAALSLLDGELLSLGNVCVLQLSVFLRGFNCLLFTQKQQISVSAQGLTSPSLLQVNQPTPARAILLPLHRYLYK